MTSPTLTDENGPLLPSADGKGLPGLLDYFNRQYPDRIDAIKASMKELVPGFTGMKFGAPDQNLRRLDFLIERGLTIQGKEVSAGVRLLLFFVSLVHHPVPPKLILIEEPETGIHPRRIADVMKLLRKITLGEINGHPTQVILSTHSPYLLDCVDLDTDQVLVFRREEDGSRTASPVDAEGLKGFLNGFLLGEIWFNEGDERLVAPRT